MAKISVIGAGIGGMSAAARLARQGHDVTIYENSDRSGGKCRTEWFGDYGFDTGPSLLTLPAVYRDLFLKTGKRLEHILELTPVDPAFSYHFNDGKSVTFPNLSNPKTYLEIEKSFGSAASDSWKKIINRAEKMWEASRESFVESELKSIWPLLKRKNLISQINQIAPLTSLRELSKKYNLDPHLRMIVDRYATYTGSDPRSAPAVLLTIAFVESTFGAWHIKGGIGQLSEAIEQRCRDLGVRFEFNTLVSKILTNGNLVTGVEIAGGQQIASDIVVANSDAEYVYNKLLADTVSSAKSERRKLRIATKSLAGFSLLLGLDNSKDKSVQLNHHNVYFPQDYDSESETGWDWNHGGEDYAKTIIKKMDALGLNVSNRLDFMKYRTPADLERYAMAPGGSIYGTSSNSVSSAFLRARNRSKVKGLFCVGGSAHPGGGLPLVGISAELVANAIGKA